MTRIKLCGLRREEDVILANSVMPDYIGYVFAKASHRYIAPEKAIGLTSLLNSSITPVGVFVDEPLESVVSICETGAVRLVQLHGNESESYISELKARGISVMKAFKVKTRDDIISAERCCADCILLDSGSGSGKTFDWSLIKGIKRDFFLAGGLTAENVSDAVRALRPFAVDASSCLEKNGFKDRKLTEAFVQAVRTA